MVESEELAERRNRFINQVNLTKEQEEAINDFTTWLLFRIDYGGHEI